jgi:hypothetical protein
VYISSSILRQKGKLLLMTPFLAALAIKYK